ncbi:MAG: ribosome silencing factor [Rubrivivax sp.]
MDIRKLQRAIVDGLEDVKAQHIAVFNTEHLSALFERVIIASGASNRQTKSLAASVRDSVQSRGLRVMRTEGEANGEWIIVDCGAAVVHIMQPAIREYYHLEEIWGGKAVNMKFADVEAKGLPKASAPSRAPDKAPARAVAQDKLSPAKKRATAKRPAAPRSAVPAAKKTAARKTPLRKTPVRKMAPVTSAGPKRKPTATARPTARKTRA